MRNNVIDIMRGICILTVVNQHAVTAHMFETLGMDKAYNVTTSFNMMVFLAIAGYFAYGKVRLSHMLKWVLPILIFSAIFWAVNSKEDYLTYFSNLVMDGFTGTVLWFLWCLVLCYVLAYVLEHRGKINFTLAFCVLMIVLLIIPFYPLGIRYLKWYGLAFFAGYALKHYDFKTKWAYLSLAIFPLIIYLFDFLIPYQDKNYAYLGFTIISHGIMNGQAGLVGIYVLFAVMGSLAVYSLSVLLNKVRYLNSGLAYLGKISIGIFLIHTLCLNIVDNYAVSIPVSLAISIVAYEILHRFKFFNSILFGDKWLVEKVNGAVSSV